MGSFRLKKWERESEEFLKGYDAGIGHCIKYFIKACRERGIEINDEKRKWIIDRVIQDARETKENT